MAGDPTLMKPPTDLPQPQDDGAVDHLRNGTAAFPSIALPSTAGNELDVSSLAGLTILFCYPRTAAPDETVPDEWNAIPGARGCTPQACSFRDAADDLQAHGATHIFGISTQDTPYQQELKERTHLPYQLLSDERLGLAKALRLPTMEFRGMTLLKRVTLAVREGRVIKVWYPVFPPAESAQQVLEWLKTQKSARST